MTEDDAARPSVVLVMAEYGDLDGLWDRTPARGGALRAADLGVSAELVVRLREWNAEYDRTALVGWDPPAAEDRWVRTGLHLAHDLQHELGPDVEVRYHHDGDPRPVTERRGR